MRAKLIINGVDFSPWILENGLEQYEIERQERSGGGAPSGYQAAQRAMEMAAEKFARRSEPITLGELQQAFAGAVSGMEVSMDGQKVGRVVTTRQEYDDRSYSR